MKVPSLHKGVVLWVAISAIFAILLAGVVFGGMTVKKPINAARAEIAGHKVVLSYTTEKIISQPYDPEALNLPGHHDEPAGDDDAEHSEKADKPVAAAALQVNKEGHPRIVIIIGGLGLSASSTERALTLPPSITFGFSPYAADAKKWIEQATATKHDILVNLPMQPVNYPVDDPGPYALLTGLSDDENLARLGMVLAKAPSVGVYGSPQESFTLSTRKVQPILDMMKSRNLLFVYGGTTAATLLQQAASAGTLPLVVNDIQLDKDISAQAIEAKLAELEKIAKTKGYAVAIGNPYPVTVKLIENWVGSLESKGLQVVPISGLFTNFRK